MRNLINRLHPGLSRSQRLECLAGIAMAKAKFAGTGRPRKMTHFCYRAKRFFDLAGTGRRVQDYQ